MLEQVVILLAASVIAVTVFRRLSLPPILGYLFVGIVVGPFGLAWLDNTEDIRFLAEFGVVFLLFTLGLEFSFSQLIAMRRAVLGLGGAQVALSTLAIGAVALMFGLGWEIALILGGALAMSSTAIVIKQLTEQMEINQPHGRLSVGVLLFQDVAFIPFLILIAALSGAGENSIAMELFIALLTGAFVFAAMLGVGRWLLRPMFHEIAYTRSPELFTLTVLLVSVAAAWLTHEAGLSLALGAFLAGMMLGETEFKHQVEADIRPFRDILLGLFFITIGMLLNLDTLPSILHWVILATVALVVFKTALITFLARKLCTDWRSSLRTGISLSQGGEFGLAVALLAISAGILTESVAQIVLATVIFTMVLAPSLVRFNGKIASKVFSGDADDERSRLQHDIATHPGGAEGHVLIIGYGRVGQNVARFLENENIDFVALDLDAVRVRTAREAGDPVYYGDATQRQVLEAADIAHARVVVITYYDTAVSMKILSIIRDMELKTPTLVRTRDDVNLERLQEAGATEVIPDTLEASLMVASHLLQLLDVPVKRIVRSIQKVRDDRYSMMRTVFRGQHALPLDDSHAFREQLYSVEIAEGCHASGQSLDSLNLEDLNVSVTAVRRDGIVGKDPAPDMIVKVGDVLVLYGNPEALTQAEERIFRG